MLVSSEVIFLCCILIVNSYAKPSVEGCLMYMSSCVVACPEGLIETEGDCSKSSWMAQKTCDEPVPQLISYTCNFSRCDCPDTEVMDTITGLCYKADECPTMTAWRTG
ncbi:hypothetical protein O0L34_g4826 [Tuta absoluta]|nr:hypothetical protein O0L34_g4825 [Tuta absoluta]KAJ2945910.1 hypothetical protein O0L34_g4826 [Tuta absoluta]